MILNIYIIVFKRYRNGVKCIISAGYKLDSNWKAIGSEGGSPKFLKALHVSLIRKFLWDYQISRETKCIILFRGTFEIFAISIVAKLSRIDNLKDYSIIKNSQITITQLWQYLMLFISRYI